MIELELIGLQVHTLVLLLHCINDFSTSLCVNLIELHKQLCNTKVCFCSSCHSNLPNCGFSTPVDKVALHIMNTKLESCDNINATTKSTMTLVLLSMLVHCYSKRFHEDHHLTLFATCKVKRQMAKCCQISELLLPW